MNGYMTDEELLKLISDVEENDIVEAPPQLAEKVIEKVNKKNRVLEYRRFRNRVIASVAAILVVTISGPKWLAHIPEKEMFISYNYEPSYHISDFLNGRED